MQVPRRTARASADDNEQRSLTDLHMLGQLNHHPNQAMAAIRHRRRDRGSPAHLELIVDLVHARNCRDCRL